MRCHQLLGFTCILSIFLLTLYRQDFLRDVGDNYGHRNLHRFRSSDTVLAASMKNSSFHLKKMDNLTSTTASILMYNKVPKCGSSTMSIILKRLSQLNKFDISHGRMLPRRRNKSRQRAVINMMSKRRRTSLHNWITHAFFFDDVGNDNKRIIWMNVVRDPVDRFISNFYYDKRRAKHRTRRLKIWRVDPEEYYSLNLDECLARNHPLCTWTVYPYGELQLSFFCGQDMACSERSNRWALQRAMYHVDKYYSVVGLLEEPALSHAVLEAYIPQFFRGIQTIHPDSVKVNVAKDDQKKPVSNETRIVLKNNLKEDYELYEYLRQRLHAQARAIGLIQTNRTRS